MALIRGQQITGSVASASYAQTASYALNSGTTFDTGSFVTTSSFNSFTGSYNTGSFTGSFTGSLLGTASYASNSLSASIAQTASYYAETDPVFTSKSGSFVTTSSFNSFTASYSTGSFTGSFTGSLLGTASYATTASYITTAQTASYVLNSVSSSYAATASLAPLYLPLTGGTISGNVTVLGTASIAFLNVQYESASVIYSSGSNQFGDATNDTQTLIGTVIVSGSQHITGSLNVTGGITGSLLGTASYATNALSASYAPTIIPSGRFGISNTSGSYTYYTTFSSSMAAATSGQTVEMFADVVETTNIAIALMDGVNINGNGHTYTLTQAGTANCIQDGGVAVNCAISNITFKRLGGTGSDVNTLPMYITGASKIKGYSTNLIGDGTNIRCLTINNILAEVYGVYCEGTSPVTITSGTLYNSEVRSLLLIGINVATNGKAVKCTGYGYYNGGIVSAGTLMDCTAYDAYVGAMVITAGSATNCVGYGGGGAGITLSGTGVLANCTGYGVGGNGITINGGIYVIGCIGYSTAAAGISMINGIAYDSLGYSTVNNGIYVINSGATITDLRSCKAVSLTSTAIFMDNATSGCKIYNTEAYSKWNNAAGHGIKISGNNAEIVQCILEVTNASANAINAATPFTVKYANNAFKGSTLAINANITQGITNTHDNQGNILI